MADIVSSAQNSRLKLTRLVATRKGRVREGAFAVEGEDLIIAGVSSGHEPRFILANADDPPAPTFLAQVAHCELVLVPGRMLGESAELAHPPRVIAVFDLIERESLDVAAGPAIYLDGLKDPGNVGSVLRTANAFDVRSAVLGPETADPFSPKASRASMGAIFDVACSRATSVDSVLPADALVVALDAGNEQPIWELDLANVALLVIGSEREGLTASTRERADLVASIPQRDGVDSLNAAAAAAIALYEWRRQRAGARA